jgi:hypothetical protein
LPTYSPLTHTRVAEELIRTLENPHHRAILENYRRHALLEVAGRWEEILTPEMTIDHPVYRISVNGSMTVLDGRDAVARFYHGLTESGTNVFGPVEQKIAVADWGFAAEALFQQHLTGAALLAQGGAPETVAEDGTYRIEWSVNSAWHYTADARLIGEHIYAAHGPRTIERCDPDDMISPAQASALLAPVLEAVSI